MLYRFGAIFTIVSKSHLTCLFGNTNLFHMELFPHSSVTKRMNDDAVAVIVVYKEDPGVTHHEHLVFCGPGK